MESPLSISNTIILKNVYFVYKIDIKKLFYLYKIYLYIHFTELLIYPLILTITLKNFIRSLGMYQKGVNEEPHFKKKFSYQSFTLINNNTIKLDDFYVFIPKVGNIKYVKTMM